MKKILIVVLIAVLFAGFALGWVLRGGNDKDADSETPPQASQTQGIGNEAGSSNVKNLVEYRLPDGWQEAECDGRDVVYVLPHEIGLNCAADPSGPISIALDPQGATDCSQLDGQQGVRRHVCSSVSIDGRKTLKASTTSTDGRTVSQYLIDSGKGIVKVEYRYQGQAAYQEQYDKIADSIRIK